MTPRALACGLWIAVTVTACGTTAEEHFANAENYISQGKPAEAAVEYRRALQEDEDFGAAQYGLAQAYEQIGDYANAARSYVRASELLPANVEAQIKGASMLLLLRRFDEARGHAEMALRAEPRNVRALLLQAHALAGLKRTGLALNSIQEAIALDPTRADTYADFAMFQFSTGSFEQGEVNLQRAADANPPSAVAQLALASLYWAQGRFAEAEDRFKRAAAAAPADVRTSRALATFYLANNRPEAAEAHLTSIADQTKSASARLALADYLITAGRYPDAAKVLALAATDPAGFADANSRLAALAYAGKRTAEAHRIIDDTLERQPGAARAILTKANFLLVERKLDEAEATLKAAAAADPTSIPIRFALGRFHASRQNAEGATAEFTEVLRLDPESVPARMELARLNLAIGKPDVATDFAQQAADARPSIEASLLLARALVSNGELSRAETVLRPHLASSRPDLLALAGGIYVGIGEETRGRQLLEQAAAADPTDPEALEALVTMDLQSNNVARARARVDQRLQARPTDSRVLVLGARTRGASGDPAGMVELLNRAIKADSTNTTAYALLGQALAAQGKLAEALREYERVVERDPRSVPAHIMAAFLLEGLGRKAEAEKRYERVLELDPRAPVAANNLAWLIAERRGNLDLALQLAQTAKEGLPEASDVNDTLAWIYYLKDLPDLALPLLRLAIERAPNNPIYHHHSGLAHLKTDDIDSARVSFEAALKLSQTFDGADDAREALRRLR
jgi:putative PEP-CTERM system TPR-repeat lipoprotein